MNKNKENNLKYTVIPVGRAKDIRGQKFGRLTVIDRVEHQKGTGKTFWLCKCECGNYSIVDGYALKGRIRSCGCLQKESARRLAVDLKGMSFGRLKVLYKSTKRSLSRDLFWVCECDCGEKVTVNARSLRTNNTRSCGCLQKEIARSMSGEKSPNYNPKLTDDERMYSRYQLHGENINNWRTSVFIRDDRTCQSCKQYGGTLNAHHLNAWNSHPDERFDIDNGITLCTDCHTSFHKKYGYGNNTKEQFNEYLNTN